MCKNAPSRCVVIATIAMLIVILLAPSLLSGLRPLPVGTPYAVWVGIGALGVARPACSLWERMPRPLGCPAPPSSLRTRRQTKEKTLAWIADVSKWTEPPPSRLSVDPPLPRLAATCP